MRCNTLNNLKLNESRTSAAASTGYLNATELADYLVKKGVPFREAHEIVGKAVVSGISQKRELHEMDLSELRSFSKKIDKDVFKSLDMQATLSAKNVTGGTSPKQVAKAIKNAKRYLGK